MGLNAGWTPIRTHSQSWRRDDTITAATGQGKGAVDVRKIAQRLLQSSPGGKNMELTFFQHLLDPDTMLVSPTHCMVRDFISIFEVSKQRLRGL